MIVLYQQTRSGMQQVYPTVGPLIENSIQIEEILKTAQYIAVFHSRKLDEIRLYGPNNIEEKSFEDFVSVYPDPMFLLNLPKK